jgi:hypothetical protein
MRTSFALGTGSVTEEILSASERIGDRCALLWMSEH